MSAFQYESCLPDGVIRLIKLPPNSESHESLHLQLEEYQIHQAPPYHALSYTWGPPRKYDPPYTAADEIPVIVNDFQFALLPNLHDALQEVIKRGVCTHLWCDAICINQNDNDERASQVAFMDEIYGLAHQVVIWIGQAGPLATEIKSTIEQMAAVLDNEIARVLEQNSQAGIFGFEDPEFMRACGLASVDKKTLMGLVEFFERRWFQRIWIIQEIALSREAVLLWGEHEIRWEDIAQCSQFLIITHMSHGLAELRARSSLSNVLTPIGATCQRILVFGRICNTNDISSMFSFDQSIRLNRLAGWSKGEMRFAHILAYSMLIAPGFESTDGRDMVYAIYGILNRIAKTLFAGVAPLKPDYDPGVSPADVFTDLMRLIITECNHIGLLTLVPDEKTRKTPNLPSWVPDLCTRMSNPSSVVIMSEEGGNFDPGNSKSRGVSKVHVDGRRLHIDGTKLGIIKSISEPCVKILGRGKLESYAAMLLDCDLTYAFTGQDRIEVLWRTMIYDTNGFQHPAPDAISKAFSTWLLCVAVKGLLSVQESGGDPKQELQNMANLKRLAAEDRTCIVPSLEAIEESARKLSIIREPSSTGDSSGSSQAFSAKERQMIDVHQAELLQAADAFQTHAFSSIVNRRLFVTEDGHIGIGPESLATGDLVCIAAAGCPSLLVLRTSNETSNAYRLMGDAYVHGAMHGEAVDEHTTWEEICLV